MVAGLSQNMSNTLDKLEDECSLSNYRAVQKWSRPEAEARAAAVKMTLSLYREQAQRDYQLLRTTKEQNILLAQLVNAQAIENLALNARVLTMVGARETEIKSTAGAELKRATDRYKIAMNAITESCIAKLEA